MISYSIKVPLVQFEGWTDVDPLKFGLNELGYKMSETLGGETSVSINGHPVGILRSAKKKFDISPMVDVDAECAVLNGVRRAYALGLLTKYANKKWLRLTHINLNGNELEGELSDLKVDGKRIPFIIDKWGCIKVSGTDASQDYLVKAIAVPLAKQLGVRPETEVIREI
jgi:hypothetical protein